MSHTLTCKCSTLVDVSLMTYQRADFSAEGLTLSGCAGRWAHVARKSHPGCKIGLVMDQDTQLEDPAQARPAYSWQHLQQALCNAC